MKKTVIHIGQPVGGKIINPHEIILSGEFPSYEEEKNSLIIFSIESEKIEKILWDSLPGGTYDALLGMMLKRQASKFVVPYGAIK